MAREKVVYHLFLQISLVPPTGNCFVFLLLFFLHFLGRKLILLLSSGLPPSILSPEASNPQRFTQAEEPAAASRSRTHTNTNNSKTDAQTFTAVQLEYVYGAHANRRAQQHRVRQKPKIHHVSV